MQQLQHNYPSSKETIPQVETFSAFASAPPFFDFDSDFELFPNALAALADFPERPVHVSKSTNFLCVYHE